MKVSVIIPIYKVEAYIERCARSLFRQTLSEAEFIFIDDCTPDQSMVILNELIGEYHERITLMGWLVRIERMPKNSGQAAVRRYGMQIATGDYIAFCDSDDWMEASMLREMYEKAVSEDCDVVVCDFNKEINGNIKNRKGMRFAGELPFVKELLLAKSCWNLWNKLFRRSLYTEHQLLFPSDGNNMGEDIVLTIEMVYFSRKVGYINNALYNYCENSTSIMHQLSDDVFIMHQNQLTNNIGTLEAFFKLNNDTNYKNELSCLKCKVKIEMINTAIYNIHPKQWLKLFPELYFRVLTNPYVGLRSKLVYYKWSIICVIRSLRRH